MFHKTPLFICFISLAVLASFAAMKNAAASQRTILPKPGKLSRHIYVCDAADQPLDDTLFYISIQGIVNQTEPRLYLMLDKQYDQRWLEWLKERDYIDTVTPVRKEELAEFFRKDIKGAVITDPKLHASVNIATMIASVNRFAICTPESAKKYDLPIKSDLRGRFNDNATAYSWAIENLFPKMNKNALCSLMPYAAAGWLRDYLIQNKIFTFWVTSPEDIWQDGAGPKERETIERLFKMTPPNTPIVGFWSAGGDFPGVTEYGGLVWAGGYGKPTVAHDWATNGSIHSAVRVNPSVWKQRKPTCPKLRRDKVYVAVNIIESGDAPWFWERYQPMIWDDPNRGKIPISWCVGPATMDINPAILEWYYRNATPNDYFFTAVSGATYMMPIYYALKCSDPEAVWKDFIGLTNDYMNRLDLDILSLHMDAWGASPTHYGDSPIYKRYIDGIPRLRSILSDFGRMDDLDPARAVHTAQRGVTVFHCLNRWDPEGIKNPVEYLVNDIRANTPIERPGFMHVMAFSWSFRPTHILEASKIVGDDYVFVTARDLDHLYRLSRAKPR